VQEERPVLSRTPFTSPEAPPEVVLDPDATHAADSHSISASAELDAASSRMACPSTARSLTCELDSAPHPPVRASHFEEPLVVRTGAAAPRFAGVPVTVPVVALLALPAQVSESQSRFAPAELDAAASPSVSDADRTRPSCSSAELSTSVWL
jgi:hypothetical protein